MRTGLALAVVAALGLTACSTAPALPRTAGAIVAAVAHQVPTARPGVVYTADTDPDHLLGTPTGYLSKATFTDSRIGAGGSVEVFADAGGARVRQQRIQRMERDPPLLGTEYTFTDGDAVLRLPGGLTPAQAAEYKTAFEESGTAF